MKPKKSDSIKAIYIVFVEEPDDYYFHPRGVLVVDEELNLTLICLDSDHNFLMKVIRKFPYEDLESGVDYQRYAFELKNITEQMIKKYGNQLKMIPQVLSELYQVSPRQYSFLEKAVTTQATHPRITP